MQPIYSGKAGRLDVRVYKDVTAMGDAAAAEAALLLQKLLAEKAQVSVIFAAAPSQNSFLDALCRAPGIDWSRVTAMHMDEYIGLPADAPQGFGNFLRGAIFDRLPFGQVHYLNGNAPDIGAECTRYAALLEAMPPDIVFMGIGENGHIAFNDPGVADFDDPALVKRAVLDETCRLQQVHDGCFAQLSDVPKAALTLTVPALMRGHDLFCMVPRETKRDAVTKTVRGEITEDCPASILQTHPRARLYLDPDSGRDLL